MRIDDTIAAIATPIGESGIGVIRISGRDAFTVAGEIFHPASGVHVHGLPTHTAHYGYIEDPVSCERIDDGILTVFRAPRSYTGEDSVEISCHGGIVPLRRVLNAALQAGARLAEPGEFTKRAFLNGRLDLAQAEAVLDIIRSQTDEAMRIARGQLDGRLSSEIRKLRDSLIAMMANIEASIDFPDEVGEVDMQALRESLRDTLEKVRRLLETAECGRVYREGIRAVIVGRPNVGKSSLLNAILRDTRAIVTPLPGTTRDVIEESVNIRGIPVRAIDTAGVRTTEDIVEQIGVELTRKKIEEADLVLAVIDASEGFTDDDRELLRDISDKKVIIVLNKVDLVRAAEADEIVCLIKDWICDEIGCEPSIVKTAAPSDQGISDLEDLIAEKVLSGVVSHSSGTVVSNIRHRQALEEALVSLQEALRTSQSEMPVDCISIDLKAAAESLGKITGETVTEDVIDRIFSEFCIGK
ncbi:MAG: tRNA uridine-5-carboxymethylaminomethyl(34) synthesis GTPase MnmE [Armatimonadota bacterium]|nr:tRNA uridine-5-carboxymethylaminomethyl(34) synthesis GTPase MnmE [Armatimonadota bacterium]